MTAAAPLQPPHDTVPNEHTDRRNCTSENGTGRPGTLAPASDTRSRVNDEQSGGERPQPRHTLTVLEVAQILDVSDDAVYDAAGRGEIPSIRVGRRVLIPTAKLADMLGVEPSALMGGANAT